MVLIALAFPANLLLGWTVKNHLPSLPVGCGAKGPDFQVECAEEIPFLRVGTLPYPTPADSASHPIFSLDGIWVMRLDPGEQGMDSAWYNPGIDMEAWQDVVIPSTYNAYESEHRGHEGVAWFRLRFAGPSVPSHRFARLGFDGVLLRSTIWLNGKKIGTREGGHTPFYFDVTHALLPKDTNVLVVRADNRLTYRSLPPKVREDHNPVWAVYGGIYRSVRLELPARHYAFKAVLSGEWSAGDTAMRAVLLTHRHEPDTRHSSMDPEPQAKDMPCLASPGYTLHAALFDWPSGANLPGPMLMSDSITSNGCAPIEAHRFRFPLSSPRLWSLDSTHRYAMRTILSDALTADTLWFITGLREIGLREDGFHINGRRTFLKGISKMEDHPRLGQSQHDSLIRIDLELIRDMNANYIRLAHHPHHLRELHAARDMGLLVSEELPHFHAGAGWTQWFVDFQRLRDFPWSSFGLRQIGNRDFLLECQKQLIEMVERSINNPSLIFYSLGNESFSLGRRAGEVYGWMDAVARAFDPSRPGTFAEMTYYLSPLDRLRRSAESLKVASLNMYFGWYFGETSKAAGHIDDFHRRFPDKPLMLSEFGAEADPDPHAPDAPRRGDRVYLPRPYTQLHQEALLLEYLAMARERPWVAGISPWVFADFHCPWFPNNPVPDFNTKGIVTREREPKSAWHALQRAYGRISD